MDTTHPGSIPAGSQPAHTGRMVRSAGGDPRLVARHLRCGRLYRRRGGRPAGICFVCRRKRAVRNPGVAQPAGKSRCWQGLIEAVLSVARAQHCSPGLAHHHQRQPTCHPLLPAGRLCPARRAHRRNRSVEKAQASIPLRGNEDIPIQHEFEFEWKL